MAEADIKSNEEYMRQAGIEEGKTVGRAEGRVEGRAEGRIEGMIYKQNFSFTCI